jgi:hypothetical protein
MPSFLHPHIAVVRFASLIVQGRGGRWWKKLDQQWKQVLQVD